MENRAVYLISKYTTFNYALIDKMECRHMFSIFTVDYKLKKITMKSCSPRCCQLQCNHGFYSVLAVFEWKEDMDSLHLFLCTRRQSGSKIMLCMSIFLGEFKC